MKKLFMVFILLFGCSTDDLSKVDVDATVDAKIENIVSEALSESATATVEAKPSPTPTPTPIPPAPAPSPKPAAKPYHPAHQTPTPIPPGHGPHFIPDLLKSMEIAELDSGWIDEHYGAYNRSNWSHWSDDDGNCINVRHEVLISESIEEVVMDGNCKVKSGEWYDPYINDKFTESKDLDVDHMVPLSEARNSGGYTWDKETKKKYANDMSYENHLIAVSSSANRSKGASTPDKWKPANEDFWCEYAEAWVVIKFTWGLTITMDEAVALKIMSEGCEPYVGSIDKKEISYSFSSFPEVAEPPKVITSKPDLQYDPFGPDKNCGDFSSWENAQSFFVAAGGPEKDPHRLDGDGDGDACASLR